MAKPIDNLVQRIFALVEPTRGGANSDGQLLARWVSDRDNRAFAALVGRHGALVWRVGRSMLAQPEDAEDVFQATFLVLARKAAGLRRHPSIAGWLHQTAHHLAYKARTQAARRQRREEIAIAKPSADPLEEISVREARAVLGDELERLPRKYREPLLLCLYEGATQDEAAQRLGCSLNTVKRRLERGRELLKHRLARRGLAPASALALTLYSRTHVSAQLMQQTIAAAGQFGLVSSGSGQALSATAAALAHGVLRAVLVKKTVICVSLVVAMSALTLVGVSAWSSGPKTVEKEADAPRIEPAAPARTARAGAAGSEGKLDADGDPLPAGAVGRVGSSRLRPGGHITRMRFTPDGKAVASANESYLSLWDTETGKLRWRKALDHPASFQAELAISDDGKRLAMLDATEFKTVELRDAKLVSKMKWSGHNKEATPCAFAIAPDLSAFAVGYTDSTVRVHDATTSGEIIHLVVGEQAQRQLAHAMSFSGDAKLLFVKATNKPDVVAYDIKTGKLVRRLGVVPELTGSYLRFLSPSLRFLVSVGNEKVVLRDANNQQARDLAVDKTPFVLRYLQCGAFTPDESLLAAGGSRYGMEMNIMVFDTATGKERARLPGRAISLAFAPDGKTLASADDEGCIALWDVASGKAREASSEVRGLGPVLFAASGKQIITFGDGVSWWDAASGKLIRHLAPDPKWHGGYVPAVSPDGKLLAALFSDGFSDGGRHLQLIDAGTGKQLRTLFRTNSMTISGYSEKKANAAFSPDATKLYYATGPAGTKFKAGEQGERVVILDVATGVTLGELKSGSGSRLDRIAVSPDGRWLAAAGTDDQGGDGPFGFRGKAKQGTVKQGKQGNLEFSPAGNREYIIQLWDLVNGTLAQRLGPSSEPVSAISFSADSSHLAATRHGSEKPMVTQVWDVASGKEIKSFTGHQSNNPCVALSTDSRMLATGSDDKTVRLWETATGKERARITGHETPVFSVDCAPDGRTLAAASSDAVYLWDVYAALKPKLAGDKLSREDMGKLWQTLADMDATTAFQAMCELIARPNEATALLKESWRTIPRAKPEQMRAWLDEIYSDQPAVKKAALAELERFAPGHEELLRETLKQTGAVAIRQELEKILGQIDNQRLRRGRMLEVLEHLGTAEARQFLQELAEQKQDALLAREAAAGLKREGTQK